MDFILREVTRTCCCCGEVSTEQARVQSLSPPRDCPPLSLRWILFVSPKLAPLFPLFLTCELRERGKDFDESYTGNVAVALLLEPATLRALHSIAERSLCKLKPKERKREREGTEQGKGIILYCARTAELLRLPCTHVALLFRNKSPRAPDITRADVYTESCKYPSISAGGLAEGSGPSSSSTISCSPHV